MRYSLSALIILALAACSSPDDFVAPVTTSERAPLDFAVQELVVENGAPPPAGSNFKDKRNSARLAEDAVIFLQNRIMAAGGEGWLRATVTRADMIERPREVSGGLRGLLTREPDAEFVADLTVRLTVMGGDGLERGFVEVKVGRTRPLLESLNVLERSAEAQTLIDDLLRQLDDQLTRAVEAEMGEFRSF